MKHPPQTLGAEILDALCRNIAGRPAVACTWRELLRVRDLVDDLLDRELDRRQSADAVRSPHGFAGDRTVTTSTDNAAPGGKGGTTA